jgi:hypothetical protein
LLKFSFAVIIKKKGEGGHEMKLFSVGLVIMILCLACGEREETNVINYTPVKIAYICERPNQIPHFFPIETIGYTARWENPPPQVKKIAFGRNIFFLRSEDRVDSPKVACLCTENPLFFQRINGKGRWVKSKHFPKGGYFEVSYFQPQNNPGILKGGFHVPADQ